jgi:L-lactate dehydrogenase (cytochrome)
VFDYVEGGADEELSLRRNTRAFRKWSFAPRSLVDVGAVDTSTTLLGRRLPAPLVLAPTGYTRLMHPAGELAVAAAARQAGLPYALSTVASTSLEDLSASGHDNLFFQLYVWRDRALTEDLLSRAWASGYRVLLVSVDTPVSGHRARDVRNGLTIPPRLTLRTLAGIVAKPRYWINLIRSPAIEFANAPPGVHGGAGVTIANISAQFDPTVDWLDLERIRDRWPGHLLVKGPISVDAARRMQTLGIDGLHLSNHGGRQLDRLPAPIDTLVEIREAVGGELCLIVDSGIRHGSDLAVAIALGADAGAVGRAYLYGLMAAGEAGVAHALRLLAEQFTRTLQLLGVTSVEELRAAGPAVLRRGGADRRDQRVA